MPRGCGTLLPAFARRLLRGTEHERERKTLNRLIAEANKTWHGVRLNQPDWSDRSHSIALTVELRREKPGNRLYCRVAAP